MHGHPFDKASFFLGGFGEHTMLLGLFIVGGISDRKIRAELQRRLSPTRVLASANERADALA